MSAFLLSVHVLAAIVFIGPVTAASSMFPPLARRALTAPSATGPTSDAHAEVGAGSDTDAQADADAVAVAEIGAGPETGADSGRSVAVLRALHRVSRGYAIAGLSVPVFGVATAISLDVLTDAWLLTSIALTALAAGVLALRVLPAQAAVIAAVDAPPDRRGPALSRVRSLSMTSGVFALLWAIVVVLMIVRPGSTTGV